MDYHYSNTQDEGFLMLAEDIARHPGSPREEGEAIQILWNRSHHPVTLEIDAYELELCPGQVVTTTYLHRVEYRQDQAALTAFRFNREFYCIVDHDEEVSCNGILFFGTQSLPRVTIPQAQKGKFNALYEVFVEEFQTPDKIQGDMLQMLLKRLIIMVTRLAREQHVEAVLNPDQVDIIRRFNVLVDIHFKTKRKVSEYAEMLFRSPKTLSNLFAIYNQKSPQQIIQDRIALEAKRLLHYTDKQHQEIAFDLGFTDASHFSRFFKKTTGSSPTEFRKRT